MALSECVECGGKLSSAARSCPHCGRVTARAKAKEVGDAVGNIGCTLLLVLALFGAIGLMFAI